MVEERILIGNMRSLSDVIGYIDIRVDRASPLGNPFELSNEEIREVICQAYKEWLLENIREGMKGDKTTPINLDKWKGLEVAKKFKNPSPEEVIKTIRYLSKLLMKGKKIRLLCWCSPLNCHSEGIKEVLEEIVEAHHKTSFLSDNKNKSS